MATKSFLKSVAIWNQKQKRNIARAMAQSEAFVKSTPYREEPAKILSRDGIKKRFVGRTSLSSSTHLPNSSSFSRNTSQ